MIVLHPDGASVLLKHVEDESGMVTCLHCVFFFFKFVKLEWQGLVMVENLRCSVFLLDFFNVDLLLDILMEVIKRVTTNSPLPPNILTSMRAVTNLFKNSCYYNWLLRHRSEVNNAFFLSLGQGILIAFLVLFILIIVFHIYLCYACMQFLLMSKSCICMIFLMEQSWNLLPNFCGHSNKPKMTFLAQLALYISD